MMRLAEICWHCTIAAFSVTGFIIAITVLATVFTWCFLFFMEEVIPAFIGLEKEEE